MTHLRANSATVLTDTIRHHRRWPLPRLVYRDCALCLLFHVLRATSGTEEEVSGVRERERKEKLKTLPLILTKALLQHFLCLMPQL